MMEGTSCEDVKVDIHQEEIVIANPAATENGKPGITSANHPMSQDRRKSKSLKISRRSWIDNRLCQFILFIIWTAINVGFFYKTYKDTCKSPKFFYMVEMLQEGLCVAKGAAYVININCALILLPMCRGSLMIIRTYLSEHLHSYLRRLFDHAKGYHIYCGYCIVIFSLIHTVAHLFNNYNYMDNFSINHEELNFADTREELEYYDIFKTVPGATGIALILILLYMYVTSIKRLRSARYEMFWYTHHLYIAFFVLLAAHGFHGVLRYQINTDEHVPGCEEEMLANGTLIDACEEPPIFSRQTPTSWKWIIGPVIVFGLDKLWRIYRRQGFVQLKKIVLHEGKIMEIHMTKPSFKAQPGQYIRIKCPDIARLEWHPFTLTKCPSDVNDEFWVQIKVVGEWTEALSSLLSNTAKNNSTRTRVGNSCFVDLNKKETRRTIKRRGIKPIKLKVEGPFGGPMQDVTNYQIGVCVGAGIGITPFTAVLNFLRERAMEGSGGLGKLQRVYFIWVCRHIQDFSWCLNMMYDAYLQLQELNSALLVYKLFVTRANRIGEEDRFLVGDKQEWLKSILNYGRPKWKRELKSIALEHTRKSIGVFFCGPRQAGADLNDACLKERSNQNIFIYHKETIE